MTNDMAAANKELVGRFCYRLEDGKLAERWVVSDLYGLLHAHRKTKKAA
jgi:hypothetical protein